MCEDIFPLPQYDFMAWCLDKHRDNFKGKGASAKASAFSAVITFNWYTPFTLSRLLQHNQ